MSLTHRQALRWNGSLASAVNECVAEETAVALRYNERPFAVMLASPSDLDDFALGFSLSEGVIGTPAELLRIEFEHRAEGIVVEMAIPQAGFDRLSERRRAFSGYSGCGLCGSETLQAAMRPTPRVRDCIRVAPADIYEALDRLAAGQPLNAATGALHAAAFVSGQTWRIREDIGRHNALDKLIGALLREGAPVAPGFLIMSSRASYEILHKAATAGFELVIALSAPTALAIRTAEAAGITLAAFARGESMNVYTHPHRMT